MTRKALSRFDGKEGRKAYIAYQGKIYDVTQSPFWQGGEHEGMHSAGIDLTAHLAGAPHGEEVFSASKIVGTLDEEPPTALKTADTPTSLKARLNRWYKVLHLHPMSVHFPIALHFYAAFSDLVFLFKPSAFMEKMTFVSFTAATLLGIVAILAGILSWWINYGMVRSKILMAKLYLSLATTLLGFAGIWLRIGIPKVAYENSFAGILYHGTIWLTVVMILLLGYLGGKISWGSRLKTTDRTDHASTKGVEPSNRQTSQARLSYPEHMPQIANQKSPETAPDSPESFSATPHVMPLEYQNATPTYSLMIGGPAGSGIQSIERLLCLLLKRSGYRFFATKEYMSRIRGGSNTLQIRFSSGPVGAATWRIDCLVALDQSALEHAGERLDANTLIVADATAATLPNGTIGIDFREVSKQIGGKQYLNTFAAGLAASLLRIDADLLEKTVRELFKEKSENANVEAAHVGYQFGSGYAQRSNFAPGDPDRSAMQATYLDGTTASGFGFLAGGCNFVASYPMSPSTGVLNFMAKQAKTFGIVVEQAEDEIAAINMVVGAWYAGGRALTTTSGGGFALMGETLSLAGMTETPAVVYLAQRPGPATGLPTRTEQGDLSLAIHAGHGFFPKIVLAPGNLQECLDAGYAAFELADAFQVPVIVLSDQCLADAIASVPKMNWERYRPANRLVPSTPEYRRYTLSENGISPRSVPGLGDGLVCCDSDEHDERGQITESFNVRNAMVRKRQRKLQTILKAAAAPKIAGEGDIALIGWGSTITVIAETIASLNEPRLFQLHFFWVHPINPEHLEILRQTRYNVVIENNADAQFATQLRQQGVRIDHTVLQSDGFPFFADKLGETLESWLKGAA